MAESIRTRVENLRREFDDAFALPRAYTSSDQERFLFFEVGDEPYAVRITQLATMLTDAAITAVTQIPGLLGLVGLRGELVTLYSLQELFGQGRGSVPGRFVLISSEYRNVGFSVSSVNTYRSVPLTSVSAFADKNARSYIKEILSFDNQTRHVIDFSALVSSLRSSLPGSSRS
jgi:chemotaxis signal transduction protein